MSYLRFSFFDFDLCSYFAAVRKNAKIKTWRVWTCSSDRISNLRPNFKFVDTTVTPRRPEFWKLGKYGKTHLIPCIWEILFYLFGGCELFHHHVCPTVCPVAAEEPFARTCGTTFCGLQFLNVVHLYFLVGGLEHEWIRNG